MVKTRLRPYTQFLIRENIVYLAGVIILIASTAGLIYGLNQKLSEVDARTQTIRTDLTRLGTKRSALNSVVGENTENLDNDLQLMTSLIPDTEDYFSIINALEKLSQQTGFRIGSYTINLITSSATKLSLTVTGMGDSQSFLNFLRNYQVSGGRLITAEQIGLDPQQTGSIRLDLNFYNKKVSSDTGTETAGASTSLKELEAIKSKISFSFTGSGINATDSSYPTKSNPF